jgi:ATP-dependent RNA helicase SUPV3L1/SUV3
MKPGSFGVTADARPLDDEVVAAITNHRFTPLKRLEWRNHALDFGSLARLVASLETAPEHQWLARAREADDLVALKTLAEEAEVRSRLRDARDVQLLWDVCRIPDFRGISEAEHASLLRRLYGYLHDGGAVPTDWFASQIARIDRTDGDIDTLSKRLAYIRTWTYVAQRKGWVAEESHWRGETRAVEDRLSDALHEALTQRFVDRRTSVLLRRLKAEEGLVAEVNDKGEVTVEGQFVGRLEGFRFRQDASGSPDEAKTLRQASLQALKPEFSLRADRFYNAPDTEFDFTEQGGLMWGASAVGKLVAGADPLKPQVEAFVDEEAGPEVAEKVRRRLQHFIDRKVATLFEPLLAMGRDETLQGLARGFAFRLVEALGVLSREGVAEEVKALDQEARGALRKHGVRFGQYTIFLPLLLKPAPTRLRLVLWSLARGLQEFPESPPPGLVTIPNVEGLERDVYTLAGYRSAGERAIRIDMLERLADMVRAKDSRAGFEATADMLSITGMTLEQFAKLMEGLGYSAERGERPKVKAQAQDAGQEPEPVQPDVPVPEETPAEPPAPPEGPAETPEEAPVPELPPEMPEPPPELPGEVPPEVGAEAEAEAAEDAAAETEVFYTFTWAPRRAPRGERPKGRPHAVKGEGAKPEGGKPRREGKRPPKGKPRQEERPKAFESRPPKRDRIDPDNPFAAALMGFKVKE